MRRKIILTLFGFLLFFIACRNEEVYTSYETQKQELISKSLWNENTGFINAVYNHFEENFFNYDLTRKEFQKKYGILDWRYALTFGKNSADFIVIPLLKNGSIYGAIKAQRNGTKVKYSFSQDANILDLFDKIIFTPREKIKPLKDTFKSNNSTARYDYECTIKTLKTWYPVGEGGYWGERYYESCDWVWVKDYPSIDTDLHLDGWGPGDGGSGSSDPSNETQITDPCEKAKTENTDAKSLLEKTDVKSQKEKLTETIKTDENEKSFSFGKNDKGEYKTNDIKVGTNGNSVSISATNANFTVEGAAHTHTPSLYDCFSAGDFYAFHGANSANSNFKYLYVFSEDAGYVMTITNLEKFNKFKEKYPESDYFDKETGDWKVETSIYKDFYSAKKQFINSGLDEDLAFEYATAMVMSKYDMGISLSKQDSSGNFNSVFVKDNQIPIQIIPGVFANVSNFQKTDDCNLK